MFAGPERPTSSMSRAKTELKGLIPEDAKEAIGHGLRAKRSKSGAVSFDLLSSIGGRMATMQRSSPSIARLAAALAKAQQELNNPEKSLVGTRVGREEARAAPSATPPSQAGSISCARLWASMRSRRYRPPRSTRPPGWSI